MPIIIIGILIVLGVIWITLANTPDWYRVMQADKRAVALLRKYRKKAERKRVRHERAS